MTFILDEFRKTTCRIAHMSGILRLLYFRQESVNSVMREVGISYLTYWRRNQELHLYT